MTINPSALLFNQINQNAAIQNNSVAPAGKDPAGFNAFGLRVPDGKSLLLVGGNVSIDGGRLNANGGRVELGGLGVYRWFVLSLISYVLAHWAQLQTAIAPVYLPDWGEAAEIALQTIFPHLVVYLILQDIERLRELASLSRN